jgi:hypothetical protein
VVVEELLETLVCVVDTELLEAVVLEDFEAAISRMPMKEA